MFFYNNPYVSANFNGSLPVFQDTGETVYDEHDDAYDYKLVDGVWQTRAKGSEGDWVSLENNEEATNKLNEAYPDAIQDPNDDNDNDDNDNDNNDDNTDGTIDIDAANNAIGKTNNLDFKNPKSGTILDTIGDNPFLSLIHAVGTTINSFKGENYYDPGTKEDYMKVSITNPTDQDMYINPTQFEKSPNKPWKYLEDQEQVVEREFQEHLDDRHERNPDKYAKVNDFDSDLYETTGHLNYEDGPGQGDLIEEQFPDATHLNWNIDPETGNYTTAHSYMQNADDNLPATQFNINDKNYQAHEYPTPKVTTNDNTESSDLGSTDVNDDGIPDYLEGNQQRYGGRFQGGGEELYNMFQPIRDWFNWGSDPNDKKSGYDELKDDLKNIPNQILDAGAMLDPTPILDGTSAALYAARGMYDDAALSAGSMFLPSLFGGIFKGAGKGTIKGAKNLATNTTEKVVKNTPPKWSQGVTHHGELSTKQKNQILDNLKGQGQWLDESNYDVSKMLKGENIVFHGSKHGRNIVEVALPNGKTQLFYKSSGLAGKSGSGVGGTTEGLWQPYGGHGTIPYKDSKVDNWFIKDGGYEDFYGSTSYRDIAGNLDRIAIEQGWDMSDQILKSQKKYGGSLPKAQYSLNLDNYQSQGILGSEGQGYDPLSNITLDSNIGGANFGTYGAVNSNASMNSPESEPFYNISDKLYASTQNVARTQEKWDAFNADFNERLQNPSLSMLDTKTSILDTPSINQDLLNDTQRISDMATHRDARLDGRTFTDDAGNQQVVKSSEEMQESIDESNARMQEVVDQIPEYKGTQEALDDLEKSKELGFDSREDYKDFEKQQEEEALARELRTDEIKDANKDNQPNTADKLWNLKNRIVDSKAGQTFSKIGAGAINIAKPLNKIFADKEARQRKADMMNNAYLSDNMVAVTDTDAASGSKGNYDANTGIFRPDDKVVAGTTGSAKYGQEFLRRGGEAEIDMNTYKQLIAAGAQIEIL